MCMSRDPLPESPHAPFLGAALLFLMEGAGSPFQEQDGDKDGKGRAPAIFEEGAWKLPCGTAPYLVSWLSLAARETGKCLFSEWPLPASLLHLHLPFLSLALIWRAPTHSVSTSTLCIQSVHHVGEF